ncbi:putative pyridoxine 5'-phosphate oxidase superfamily flavin-nucleotide-binding protein [Kitasatospora sp. GP30]|uniref:pyridoxamine 5'-phosphate oxidase family protein n=1 Tax=Kitasatospora sp. GP30 TaxID=3035084 RepID=UPI000C70F096|nr:pyridoxamine 5'-phosphate oxidase family protein [Kitasatospora sp. GP30]MDH6143026.1 putative pyridoxine 5'-phosphate oxidase superfamily flavin-nucleotide-binding protein [Kitasatospora sp. GP30]
MNTHPPLAPVESGEQLVRRRAGFDRPGYSGPTKHRRVPAVAAEFLTAQPMVLVGAADSDGRIWASALAGRPGFLHTEPGPPDGPDAVTIAARPAPQDPLAAVLGGPTQVGMIAVEPAKRRRMRMNGHATPTGDGLRVALDQVFSNCPKYIQARGFDLVAQQPGPVRHTTQLTLSQQIFINTADTFFIATADRAGDLDTSHRGGLPGFVEVSGPGRLRFPDYSGNAMFATLGNLAENPNAGLLFIDWDTGTTLQLTGTARTDWDPSHAAQVTGAQRLVDFTVTGVAESVTALPLRWTEPGYSPFNPRADNGN